MCKPHFKISPLRSITSVTTPPPASSARSPASSARLPRSFSGVRLSDSFSAPPWPSSGNSPGAARAAGADSTAGPTDRATAADTAKNMVRTDLRGDISHHILGSDDRSYQVTHTNRPDLVNYRPARGSEAGRTAGPPGLRR